MNSASSYSVEATALMEASAYGSGIRGLDRRWHRRITSPDELIGVMARVQDTYSDSQLTQVYERGIHLRKACLDTDWNATIEGAHRFSITGIVNAQVLESMCAATPRVLVWWFMADHMSEEALERVGSSEDRKQIEASVFAVLEKHSLRSAIRAPPPIPARVSATAAAAAASRPAFGLFYTGEHADDTASSPMSDSGQSSRDERARAIAIAVDKQRTIMSSAHQKAMETRETELRRIHLKQLNELQEDFAHAKDRIAQLEMQIKEKDAQLDHLRGWQRTESTRTNAPAYASAAAAAAAAGASAAAAAAGAFSPGSAADDDAEDDGRLPNDPVSAKCVKVARAVWENPDKYGRHLLRVPSSVNLKVLTSPFYGKEKTTIAQAHESLVIAAKHAPAWVRQVSGSQGVTLEAPRTTMTPENYSDTMQKLPIALSWFIAYCASPSHEGLLAMVNGQANADVLEVL